MQLPLTDLFTVSELDLFIFQINQVLEKLVRDYGIKISELYK